MLIRMLNDNVLVMEMDRDGVTEGGIVLPDSAKGKMQQGTVVAVGPGPKMEDGRRFELDIKVSSVVFYPDRVGDLIDINNVTYRCIPERFISGVLVEADDVEMEDENADSSD